MYLSSAIIRGLYSYRRRQLIQKSVICNSAVYFEGSTKRINPKDQNVLVYSVVANSNRFDNNESLLEFNQKQPQFAQYRHHCKSDLLNICSHLLINY